MSNTRSSSVAILLSILPAVVLLFGGCVASSHFYSARVLEESKFAFTVGADDIVTRSTEKSITISGKPPFTPSFALAYGLPYRIETNLRYFPPRFLEMTFRYQVNPPGFDVVDASFNLHYGHAFDRYSYLKYGISLSKSIYDFEPFVHFSGYHFLGAGKGDFSNDFVAGVTDDFISRSRSIGFGIGIPLRSAKLFPEVDYQYFNDIKNGVWHFGAGIRIEID